MDRAISVEERIKRAEEIYNRRNNGYISTSNVKKEKKKRSSARRLIMQIFVCLMIYLAFYVFTNSDYIFSQEFLNQVRGTFSQDSKIYGLYLKVKSFVEDKISTDNEQTVENKTENIQSNETTNETKEEVKNEEKNNNEESIGGAQDTVKKSNKEEEEKTETSNQTEKKSEKSQMEKDAESIKKKISFIVPVKGRISSTFGWRNPTTSTVPKYHTGLDIAANEGTIIKSATDGKVILASSEGDYGKHYKIQNGDIIIIYAHCSKLYLKEGNKVKKGDKIAEVGSTGNSTGPHLHFEIRKEDRLVDPQLILNL